MALRALVLRQQTDELKRELANLLAERAARQTERDAIAADLQEKIDKQEDLDAETRAAVEQKAAELDDADKAAETRAAELGKKITANEAEIASLEADQRRAAESANTKQAEKPAEETKQKRGDFMHRFETRALNELTAEQRRNIFDNEETRTFMQRLRGIAGASQDTRATKLSLWIPKTWLPVIREGVHQRSKLEAFMQEKQVTGESRQPVLGAPPEAVWVDARGAINEIDLTAYVVSMGAHKVAGFIPISNSELEDDDDNGIDAAMYIADNLTGSLAKGLDKAFIYGTGYNMPLGIVTRLAQTAQPESWGENERPWSDLHTSNVRKLNISTETGATFFAHLMEAAAAARPIFSSDGLFWVCNHKTHMDLNAKALTFAASGALVIANPNTLPGIGGTIVEMDDIGLPDYEIVGGYGKNYLETLRKRIRISSADQTMFIEDLTLYKAVMRADGKPIAGEAFVVINYANTNVTTEATFPSDYANEDMNILTVTAAAGTTNGKTVLTVTNTVAESSPVLRYKVRADIDAIEVGDEIDNTWKALTSGSTQIEAAAGTLIAVVELDDDGRVISTGSVASVPGPR